MVLIVCSFFQMSRWNINRYCMLLKNLKGTTLELKQLVDILQKQIENWRRPDNYKSAVNPITGGGISEHPITGGDAILHHPGYLNNYKC